MLARCRRSGEVGGGRRAVVGRGWGLAARLVGRVKELVKERQDPPGVQGISEVKELAESLREVEGNGLSGKQTLVYVSILKLIIEYMPAQDLCAFAVTFTGSSIPDLSTVSEPLLLPRAGLCKAHTMNPAAAETAAVPKPSESRGLSHKYKASQAALVVDAPCYSC